MGSLVVTVGIRRYSWIDPSCLTRNRNPDVNQVVFFANSFS